MMGLFQNDVMAARRSVTRGNPNLEENLKHSDGNFDPSEKTENGTPVTSRPAEPIAIVGMACRFPNAVGIPAFWRLLEAGENAVTEGVPGSGVGRVGVLFPDAGVQSDACRFGAYLDDIDRFDAAFFRISPVEAHLLDPQQRLMLETSWRALEDAGMDPERLRGSRTGVYGGVSNNEYRSLIMDVSDTAEPATSLYTVSGTSFNTAVGRVSFALGLEGPAIALDTACSSSLVAVHQAVAGLQRREADLALAGGVHTILSGRLLELRGNAGMLSPDGRCATFDAAANGYVRGEGCGIVALKRLAEAEADGDRIWGVIRGSAINQDGASPGLTVPSGPAQERVIAAALAQAGIQPHEVDYLEAHGTGTEVGDPIELEAAAAAYGKGRDADHPLLIGSVKTNIGHLESSAGVAGLIKATLALKQGVVPRHLHFREPTPAVDWERMSLQVAAEATEWPRHPDHPPRAGVSGFGWSGTNAHVIVERYEGPAGDSTVGSMVEPAGSALPVTVSLPEALADPPPAEDGPGARETRLLPLSGKSEGALRDLAGRYLSWFDERGEEIASQNAVPEPLLSDMAWTAAVGRSHFTHRAGLLFDDAVRLRERLNALAEGVDPPEPGTAARVAFLFTGQGSQWVGMGRDLYESEPVARAVLDRCEEVARATRGASLLDVMFAQGGGDLYDTVWAQPAIYALECAVTALWASLGVRPDVVVGHSVGEFGAAHTAGVFGLEDGMRAVMGRSEILASVPEAGTMAAVFAPYSIVEEAVRAYNESAGSERLAIAARNGAHQVLSGQVSAVEAVSQRFEAEEIRVRPIHTSQAFHSPLVEPALDALESLFGGFEISTASRTTLVSNVTGRVVEPDEILGGAYWRRHAREAVAFDLGVRTLANLGVDLVVEVGPHAVLGPMLSFAWPGPDEGADAAGVDVEAPRVLASLQRPSQDEGASADELETGFMGAVAGAYEAGVDLSFEGLFAGESRRRISLPGYPFQRERFWVEGPKRRRQSAGHPLLGERHESAGGEITFETEVLPSDPAWLNDHRVFGRVIAPGALYGAMAVSASTAEGSGSMVIEEMQFHNALIFGEENSENGGEGREMQVLLEAPGEEPSRLVRMFSKGEAEEEWTLHAECRAPSEGGAPLASEQVDLESLKANLSPEDVPAYYRAKANVGIDLGPSLRTLGSVWSRAGEALGEICFPEALGANGLDVHPLLLDGCFQVMGAARNPGGAEDGITYLPFGWERLWLAERLPDRLLCHVRMRETPGSQETDAETGGSQEVFVGDFRLYDENGALIGELSGFMVKRATRAALLSAVEGLDDLLYEVVWRESALPQGIQPADFLPSPGEVAESWGLFSDYLAAEGVDAGVRPALMADLSRMARHFALAALEKLGWERKAGEAVDSEDLRERLGVREEHGQLFRRMLEILAKSGVLRAEGEGFLVAVGNGEPLPEGIPGDPEQFAAQVIERYAYASNEIGLFRRSAGALAEVLRGEEDPLSLLFGSGEPSAADLYFKAPLWRAANKMLGDAVRTLVAGLPEGRRLRVIEVGAGTGSATESVLPELPEGRFDYTYTDISAGFFAQAEGLFGDGGGCIEYRVLDIEKDPLEQGFDPHGYDLVIASNVLHATRYLEETLTHCRSLLAPSGHLVALENLSGQDWLDMTFGQLDGWWRFSDACRPTYALAGPDVWRGSLDAAGFEGVEILGVGGSGSAEMPDRGVILGQQTEEVAERPGVWVLAADRGGTAEALASELAARNQTVVLAGEAGSTDGGPPDEIPGVIHTTLEMDSRESWGALLEGLPGDAPLGGVAHFAALDGRGPDATTGEMAEDVKRAGASALALAQGLLDADAAPGKGFWFLTRGAQVLERERGGELAGATLWGFGKAMSREASRMQPKMIDLDPEPTAPPADLANELLYPDAENQIVHRGDRRRVARLVRAGEGVERLALPEEPDWLLGVGEDGALSGLQAEPPPLEPREVRLGIEAAGLNFWDVFAALGLIDEKFLGTEMCGHVLEVGSEVSSVSVGDRVVGVKRGARGMFGPESVTHEELVAPAPAELSATALATMPTVFLSAALSYELAGLKAGDRVLIHAGAGGVGLAAIQLAQAAGAEVFATASAPKQAYLRSLGVEHVFDSRQTKFGEEILEATGGEGVDLILNSLTAEGYIEASLSCLAQGGRFVELAARDILSEEEMAAVRPDVAYYIVKLDAMKEDEPERPGALLKDVMARLAAGELTPLIHTRWPLSEARQAVEYMRDGRHIGKIIFANSPLARGRLREDRTYLVTGGLGGIGCAVADWLAERGAGTIVLNGRRPPDPEVEEAIESLRRRGFTVRVELADVTDPDAVDEMLARMDADLPPLGGVIHSVGVLSDGALGNQSWERFEGVLWPKVLGAWHLHRATLDRDLDMFVLFSSVAGVLGNPGQSNHAAANAFLDQLAAHRRALGLPGQSIAWGAWSEIGEAEEQRERISKNIAVTGVGWMTPQQGLRAFDRLVREDAANSMVLARDWSVFEKTLDNIPPFFEDLLIHAQDAEADSPSLADDLIARLAETPAAEREALLVSFLQQELQAVLRLPGAPEPTVGFFDLGMDSLMAVELRNRLNRAFTDAYTAPNTVVFDYPDIAVLARHLAGELGDLGEVAPASAPQEQPEPERRPKAPREGEQIAVVGMACRFPGAPDISAFWRLLEEGVDAVTDGRRDSGPWSGVAGDPAAEKDFYRQGGFIEGIDQFDASFFGIRPIEARLMDPRQRLLLETSWGALEDAGIDPAPLKGTRTGAYVGLGVSEYRDLVVAGGLADSHIGNAPSVAIGRIAFVLGLMGPAVPLDMTCASSLVAVHQAAAALREGEVDLALAGGVHAVLSPPVSKFMAEFGMLSPSGRCRTFDADADGYVRGEGCGMVVMKRLSDAEADGDRIWGLVQGSAVNQNGASAALTVPNGTAQEQVLEDALSRSGFSPSEVDYLEVHATGSQLGDPIEVRASAAVFGRGRAPDRPLLLGTVKTNIGHLESAAGIAGLIKVLLAMKHGMIPKHLHFDNPNPHMDWDALPLRVTSEATAWPLVSDRPRRAGVSAFALSGTNAHVLVEGYGAPEGESAADAGPGSPAGSAQPVSVTLPESIPESPSEDGMRPRRTRMLPLSGKSDDALRESAVRYLSWLDECAGELSSEGAAAEPLLSDMAWTAAVGRSHFAHRVGVVFEDAASLREGLRAIEESDGLPKPEAAARVAFAYAGEGGNRAGMGEELYESEPVARAVLDRCDEVIRVERGASLLDVMFGRSGDLDDPAWSQPAVFALGCALTTLWASVGIRPNVVFGAGSGEVAAAHAAGVFALEEGLRFAARRGALMEALSGGEGAEAALDDIETALEGVVTALPSLTLVNQVTGRALNSGETMDGAYWRRQAREPAAFDGCAKTLAESGVEVVVEIGPDAAFVPQVLSAWPDLSGDAGASGNGAAPPVMLSSLNRASENGSGFVEAVARAYEAGLALDFAGLFAGEERRRISLPGYPFQRRRFWFEAP